MLRLTSLVTILSLFIGFNNIAEAQTLIAKNSSWKYYDNGSVPGTGWQFPPFNDASWSSGNGVLGFGDNQNTVISSGSNAYYFRSTFNISNPSMVTALELNLLRDDGAVVYINGQEVVRDNMPSGTISFGTTASSTVSGTDEDTYFPFAFCNNGILVSGSNSIAVEIHQRSSSSSDVSFDVELIDITGAIPSVTRGPYLQLGTPTSVIVRWTTDAASESIVRYGTSPGNLNQVASLGLCAIDHSVQINHLLPNTTYYYEIESSTGPFPGQVDQFFTTNPVAGTRQPVRAWILGDCGTANNDQRNVRDAYYNYVGSDHTDMILFLGDNAYDDGEDWEYQDAVFENMYEDILKKTVSWSTLGNHDGRAADAAGQTGPYFEIYDFPKNAEAGGVASGTEAYYSFDYANIHFIVLESYETDRSTGGAMYDWAEDDIQNTTQDWIVALCHHPPYTRGSHNSDLEIELIEMRQNFLPMLEDNGVDLFLSGHSHSYERTFFLNGHHGLSLTYNSNSHTVGPNGDGDGRENGDGAYTKETIGATAGEGVVCITAGSSGKTSSGLLNHPAMYTSLQELGSCALEVNRDTLRIKFIRENGTIDDYFTIIKNDVIPIEITLTNTPSNPILNCGQDTSSAVLGQLMAVSNCTTGTSVSMSYTDVINPGSCDNNYYITRTWTATDLCGNQLTHVQTIIVLDTEAPTITCNISGDTIQMNAATTMLPDYRWQITASDLCTISVDVNQYPVAGGALSPGNLEILFVASDGCGNMDSCQLNILVLADTTTSLPATITCDALYDTIYLADTTEYLADYVAQALVSDFCESSPSISQVPAIGTPLSAGNLSVWVTATDTCGNADSCMVSVVVLNSVGISDVSLEELKVYPNPATDKVLIEVPGGWEDVKLEILTTEMRLIESSTISAGVTQLETQNWARGLYFVRLAYDGQERTVKLELF